MSIFNKVRQFPEYHDMVDSFDKVRGAELNIIDGYQKGFGEDFDVFFKKQPSDLHEPFDIIHTNGLAMADQMKGDFMKKTEAQGKFPTLKAKQEQLLTEFNQMVAHEDEAKKARDAATKEEAKLAAVQSKGNQGEISKQEKISQAARTKADSLTERAEKTHADFDQKKEKHAAEFVTDWIDTMSIVLENEKNTATKLAEVGAAFLEAGGKFNGVNDPSLPKLQERLRQWEEYQMD